MAESTRRQKSSGAEKRSSGATKTRSSGDRAKGASDVSAPSAPGAIPLPGDGDGKRTSRSSAQAEERILELETELSAAKTTINALLDKAERRAKAALRRPRKTPTPAELNQIDEAGEASEAGEALDLEDDESELEEHADLVTATSKLDRIVRQRTRALAESEAQLQRKNTELQRLNEMKVEFISIATHELRTPLTSIVGYLDLMVEGRFGKMSDSMSRPMASLRRNAHRLKHLVDEMLDVSRIDSGRITLYRRPCELGEIVSHAATSLQPVMDSKNLDLHIEIDAAPLINADADKIRRAAAKLISNAIRHTPEGGKIEVAVDTAPHEQYASGWARLRVRGDGEGIPMHLRSRIFEPFSDVHSARHHTSSGPDSAGLGLYIARGLIDLHGGIISVDSEEGTYTEFTVLLPVAEIRI